MKPISLFGMGLLLMFVSLGVSAQTGPAFTMTTQKTINAPFSFSVNYGIELSVDWGDGTFQKIMSTNDPISGTVKGTTVKVCGYDISFIDCSESELTVLNVSEISTLLALNCSHNKLTDLDIRSNTSILKVNASHNKLTSFPLSSKVAGLTDLIINNNELASLAFLYTPNIETLICNDNGFTSMPINPLSKLRTLWCHNNKIKVLNVSNKKELTSLICYNNELTSLNVSGATGLKDIWCDGNNISTLDFSSLESVDYLSADRNAISTFTSAKTVPYLYLNDNHLGLSGLPFNTGGVDYAFSPQYVELPAKVSQTTPIDLSAQLTLSDGSVSNAQFSWSDFDGDLTVGTDYTEANGVFTFNRASGIAVCTITSDRFPDLVVRTTPVDVGAVSAVEDKEAVSMKIFTRDGRLVVRSQEKQTVRVNHISGRAVRVIDQLEGEIEIALPKGVYLVNRTKVVIY